MQISLQSKYTVDVDYHELCGALAARRMRPLWRMARELVPDVPLPTAIPWLWRWEDTLPLAKRAGEVVPIERGGDRRVLAFANPGLGGLPFTSPTLWGAVQYLGAGESAPAHRHTPGAIRFVLTGRGATTTVNGDRCPMEPGDLLLTPNWHWHEHDSHADDAVAWFDGLDLPLTSALDAIFFENHPADRQPVQADDRSRLLHPGNGLRALSSGADRAEPLLRYPWEVTDGALEALARGSNEPSVGVEFTDPRTGGPVLPTLGCEMHRLKPEQRTTTVRRAGSAIFVVFAGAGTSVIDGQAFHWTAGDVFVTPSWSAVDHAAHEPSDLFVLTDRPVLRALGLDRESTLSAPQELDSTFDPSAFTVDALSGAAR
jgi:gentisate 1,2-dioxygenase